MINIKFKINDELWYLKDVLVNGYLYLTFSNKKNNIKLKFDFTDGYYPYENKTPSLDQIQTELYKKVENEEWEK